MEKWPLDRALIYMIMLNISILREEDQVEAMLRDSFTE